MKKWVLIFVIIFLLLIISIYLFIPTTLKVSQAVTIGCTINGSGRVLLDESGWHRWWPQGDDANRKRNSQTYSYNDYHYQLKDRLYNQFIVTTTSGNKTFAGTIVTLPSSNDSLKVFWQYEIPSSKNIFKRPAAYLQARELSGNAAEILRHLKTFLEKNENIYGVDIKRTSTDKTYLVATTRSFDHYPSDAEVDPMIEALNRYVADEEAVITGKPMLNITGYENNRHEAMVALPVNRKLIGNGDIVMRRIVTVKALVARVKGGRYTIEKTIKELNQYAIDYKLFSPAIPYQSLITDRMKERDSSKWVTDVYLPLL